MSTITAEQRNALRREVVTRLSDIDIVWRALDAGEVEKAQIRAREFADLLLLMLNDLGFADPVLSEASIELTTPPDVLRRGIVHLLRPAADQLAVDEGEIADSQAAMEEVKLVVDTCAGILIELDGPE